MTKSLFASAVVALVVSFFGYAVFAPSAPQVVTSPDGNVTYGSASSPSVTDGCTEVNGVTRCYRAQKLRTATTTPCALRSPTNATSTLISASFKIDTATTTATTWTAAKATTGFATTTYLDQFTLASGVQGTMFTQATTTGGDIAQTFAPGTYFVGGVAGIGVLTSNKLLGTCQAVFEIAN